MDQAKEQVEQRKEQSADDHSSGDLIVAGLNISHHVAQIEAQGYTTIPNFISPG